MTSQTKQCSVLHKQKYPHKTEMVTRVSLDRSKRAQKGKFQLPHYSVFVSAPIFKQIKNQTRFQDDYGIVLSLVRFVTIAERIKEIVSVFSKNIRFC